MNKRFYQVFAIVMALLIIGASSAMANTNPPDRIIDDWKSGNAVFECAKIGEYACAYKFDNDTSSNPSATVTCMGSETTITISNSNGYIFDWASSSQAINAVIVKAGRGANVWDYDPAVTIDTGLYAYQNKQISHVTFCWNGGDVPPESVLNVIKFYDADADGIQDASEVEIENWQVRINGIMCDYTPYSAAVDSGEYTISEDLPIEPNWIPTTATDVTVDIAVGETETVRFGNVCLGAGGGKTLGFWSNRNGEAKMKDDSGEGHELDMLTDLNLRNANGDDFNPTNNYKAFRSWLLSANATNMAYMLSAQLAAMALNVEAGFVSDSALVYAPGCGNTGINNNFITIQDLMGAADASLKDYNKTLSGHTQRANQECLKNALDWANNNKNFVQPEPCRFSFNPICPE